MGYWGGQLLANDYAADVRDELVGRLFAQALKYLLSPNAAHAKAAHVSTYEQLVGLDRSALTPLACVAALCASDLTRAILTDHDTANAWTPGLAPTAVLERMRAAVDAVYAEVCAPEPPSGPFWTVRLAETDALFAALRAAAADDAPPKAE